jgi:hypothetical protein
MRRTLISLAGAGIVAVVLLASSAASATEVGYGRKFGLGLEIGDPTGLTGKLWVGPTNSLDFGLGLFGYGWDDRCAPNGYCYGYGGYRNGTFNVDYLWQSNIVRGTAQLDWHIGAGGRVVWFGGCNGDCLDVGARMPVGLDLMFANPSMLELFFEIAPALFLIDGPAFRIEGALGARFYF